jgi:uncharacterized protein (TIGR03032 family)
LEGFSTQQSNSAFAQALQQITQLGQQGKLAEAEAECRQLLKQHPEAATVWHLLSLICLQQEQPEQALSHIQRALELDAQPDFYSQAGVVYSRLGKLETGIDCYKQALALQPNLIHTRFNLGLAYQKLGQLDRAEPVYQTLIAQQPDYAAAHLHLGNLYQQRRQFTAAIAAYQQAIQHQPQLTTAWGNVAVAWQAIGETEQAKQAFQRALTLDPNSVEAHNGLGATYEKQELAAPALQHYHRAVVLQPRYLPALLNLGSIQVRLNQFAAADTTYRQILQLQPNNVQILDSYLKLLLTTCQWAELPDWLSRFQQALQTQLTPDQPLYLSPLNSLFLPLSAETQKNIAQHHAREISHRMADLRQQLTTEWQTAASPHPTAKQETDKAASKIQNPKSKIRLGYVSGDFRYHAVGQLILRLFELHDRRSFEVFAYCLNADDGSAEYRKLAADCDQFCAVQNWTPTAIARQVHHDQIDILIDLAGYTNYACPELFALRPAPLQVNYLGYPGTLGADYIDYVITDAVITSPELAPTFTETCLYLPETYQLNCYPYPDADLAPTTSKAQLKSQNALPAEAFVFCCFNKSQKIEPSVFSAWMRILAQVPNSVLWLLSENPVAEANLQTAARAAGIDPARLIFAARVAKADHLRRHRCADLFLDTLHYNAHVTASDSLWAGVPILTVLGNTFASRVAASLLTAAGLPDLITPDLAAYEQLGVRLATHPTELQQLKEQLIRQRSASPLFDTARRVRYLEAGYRLIWQQHQAGSPPTEMHVAAERPVSAPKSTQSARTVKTEHFALPHSSFAGGNTITCTADAGFLEWLSQAHGSLLITTYQAGKVLLVGWNGQQVTLLARQFDKPMGVALTGNQIALTTRQEVLFFANARLLAHNYLEEQPGRYDALYLPRASYFTGDLNTHDLAFGQDGLWLVNTRFSCLASLSLEFNFVPRWYPAFISEIAPEDRCHLNGLAMVAGRPKYVTALGKTDTVGGWRKTKATGGIVIDVETDEIVLRGLSMPHSPRWYQDKLWLLNSGTGELWQVDPVVWKPQVVCALPGFGRGLTIVGDYALIGLCQIREQHIFGGLPIQERFDHLLCGVVVVDLRQGQPVGWLEFPTGCRELYDVKFLPGVARPNLLTQDKDAVREAFLAPEFAYWLRPSAQVPEH